LHSKIKIYDWSVQQVLEVHVDWDWLIQICNDLCLTILTGFPMDLPSMVGDFMSNYSFPIQALKLKFCYENHTENIQISKKWTMGTLGLQPPIFFWVSQPQSLYLDWCLSFFDAYKSLNHQIRVWNFNFWVFEKSVLTELKLHMRRCQWEEMVQNCRHC